MEQSGERKRDSATHVDSSSRTSEYGSSVDEQRPNGENAIGFSVISKKVTGPWCVISMRKRWKGGEIYRSDKPRKIHTELSEAFKQAHELISKHPTEQYAVFECIGYLTRVHNSTAERLSPKEGVTNLSRCVVRATEDAR